MNLARNRVFGWPLVAAVLAVFVAVGGVSAQEADRRQADADPEAEASASGAEDERPSWEFDISGHGGFAGLAFRGEYALGRSGPQGETVGYRRDLNFGAGIRVLRGRWGVEVRYDRLGSGAFTPLAQFREAGFGFAHRLPVPEVSSNAFAVLALAEFPWPDLRAALFVGAGFGYLSLSGDADRVAGGALPPGMIFRIEGQDLDVDVETNDLRADGGVPGVMVSAGVSLRFGRLVLRPRLDGFVGGLGDARRVEEYWSATYLLPGTDTLALSPNFLSATSMVRPRFLLFNVEVGWSSADCQSANPDLWPPRSSGGEPRR